MARKSLEFVPAKPGIGQALCGDLWIGGAVVVFAAHDEAAGELGRQWWIFAAEGAGQASPGGCGPLDNLR